MHKLGIISDTHWHSMAQAYTKGQWLLNGVFLDVDAIIHAGDMLHPEVEYAFAPYAFHAVRGNMDANAVGVPQKRILCIGGIRIGVIHGWGRPERVEVNAASEFDLHALDVLIYGHSHYPACHVCDNTLYLNPGSATDRRRAPFHTVGLLRIGGKGAAHEQKRPERHNRFEPYVLASACMVCPDADQQITAEIINIDAFAENTKLDG